MSAIPTKTSLWGRRKWRSENDSRPVDEVLPQDLFLKMLYLERKRTERSGRPFVLMLLESSKLLRTGDQNTLYKVLSALANSTRDTDAKGWFEERTTIGVIFTELGASVKGESMATALLSKVTNALSSNLSIGEINEVRLSFRIFPEDWNGRGSVEGGGSALYEGLFRENAPAQISKIIKRSMDVIGSLLALTVGAPLFLMIAIALKLTSRGPVLFRQERIGQYGRKFNFLKFRSMYVASDESVHRDYVRSFIANDGALHNGGVYKMLGDKRVTRVGRFLRQTSLDELPQFINVLIGEMSLVGPRPPVAYEVECYRIWHRARLLSAKPGITGLWQVNGRSRVQFDEMVRMDLRYANSWSVWLDLKILLQTPRAVFSGNGAH